MLLAAGAFVRWAMQLRMLPVLKRYQAAAKTGRADV